MEKEKIIDKIIASFKPLTEEEQLIVLKAFALTMFECWEKGDKTKSKEKKTLWKVQADTYETIINLLTESKELAALGLNHRAFLIRTLDQLWKRENGEEKENKA